MTQVSDPSFLASIRPRGNDIEHNYFRQIEEILRQLYQRSGGASESTGSESNSNLEGRASIARALAEIKSIKFRVDAINTSSSYDGRINEILTRLRDIEAQL